jgi:hypothetical protein
MEALMNIVQELVKEIIVFGPQNTFDSIERIKCPASRLKHRRAFERAFHTLQVGDIRFQNMSFPQTGEKQ